MNHPSLCDSATVEKK